MQQAVPNIFTMLLLVSNAFQTSYQVQIAVRDNAQRLYASKLKPVGRGEHILH